MHDLAALKGGDGIDYGILKNNPNLEAFGNFCLKSQEFLEEKYFTKSTESNFFYVVGWLGDARGTLHIFNFVPESDPSWDGNVRRNGHENVSARLGLISRLAEEFEQRSQVYGDDAKFLVEVKSGQAIELRRLSVLL
ncbi:hypothetical protein L1887_21376 [Cichorium endivia]|nr:hypothetical protein L1887_21376 [Cichorium endivia]